jgi:two-component SAPR family response regulator
MRNMDGLALLNKVKELNPKVRTILVSAYDFQNNPIFEKYLQQGARLVHGKAYKNK